MTLGRLTEPDENDGCGFQGQSHEERHGNTRPQLVVIILDKVTLLSKQRGKRQGVIAKEPQVCSWRKPPRRKSYFVWWEWPSTVPCAHPAFMFRQRRSLTGSAPQDRQIHPTRGHPPSMQSFSAIRTCLQMSTRCKVELELCQPSQSTPLLSSPDWHLHSAHPFVAIIREIKPHQTPIQGSLPPLDKSKRVPEERYCLVSVQGAQSNDGE